MRINNLERVFKGSDDVIICDVPKSYCEVRGNYWRCYISNYENCTIRKGYEDKKKRYSRPDNLTI